jgi:hypothetical protein
MISRLNRNIVASGVIRRASRRIAMDQIPDQNVSSPRGVRPNSPEAVEYRSQSPGPSNNARVMAFSQENL